MMVGTLSVFSLVNVRIDLQCCFEKEGKAKHAFYEGDLALNERRGDVNDQERTKRRTGL
jgi:hypothetical protein